MAEETADRILGAAEILFSEKGYAGMSMRSIAKLADCNVASANYYFRSKEGLIQEMLARRVQPINRRRMELLMEVRARRGNTLIPKEEIIDIMLRPLINALIQPDGSIDERFLGMISRSITDPSPLLQALHEQFFSEITNEFSKEIMRHYPNMERKEAYKTIIVLASAIIGSITILPNVMRRMKVIDSGIETVAIMDELVAYLSRGLPSSETSK